METEQRIANAIKIVGQEFGRNGRPPHGTEGTTTFDNVTKMRALEGLCGHCANVRLTFRQKDGKEAVDLGCSKGKFPLTLYEYTPFDEKAFCRSHSERVLK